MFKAYIRRPRTTQERRRAGQRGCGVDGVKVRAKRNSRRLPCAWDDIWFRLQRSWKKHRKTQWKG